MVRVDVCTLKSFSRVLYERLAIYICYIKNLKIYIQYSQEVYSQDMRTIVFIIIFT